MTDTSVMMPSGIRVDPKKGCSGKVNLTDIEETLVKRCRFGGRTSRFYSCLHHSYVVGKMCAEFYGCGIHGLVHDFHEAYISDIERPLAGLIPDLDNIRSQLDSDIYLALDIPDISEKEQHEVKWIDDAVLLAEAKLFMHPSFLEGRELEAALPIQEYAAKATQECASMNIQMFRYSFKDSYDRFLEISRVKWK